MFTVAKITKTDADYLNGIDEPVYSNADVTEYYTYEDVADAKLVQNTFEVVQITEATNAGTLPIDPRRVKPMFPRK